MSNIITSLVGKNCRIRIDEAVLFNGNVEIDCSVLDADDEWIKFSYIDKKGCTKIKILRIDSISNFEIISD